MPTQTMTPQIDDDIANIAALVRYSRQNGLSPMACVINPSPDEHPECSTLCVYAAEFNPPNDKQVRTMPLVPYFYHYAVASAMVTKGMLTEQTVSKRTGIQVHWCEFTDKVR